MKKRRGQPHQPRIVQLSPETLSDKSLEDSGKLDMKRTVKITQSSIVEAPAKRCFDLITKQLEETPAWDPTIIWVAPITKTHIRVGSMSRVIFSLDGVREEVIAMVRSFRQNRYILWTSNHSNQLQENWQLQPKAHSTMVTVTLGYNTSGSAFGQLVHKMTTRGKVKKAISEMLENFKKAAENTEHKTQ